MSETSTTSGQKAITRRWDEICSLSKEYKLVQVFENRIEAVE